MEGHESPFSLLRGFDVNFVVMLLYLLPLDDAFHLRAVCKRWKQAIDGEVRFWQEKARILAPMMLMQQNDAFKIVCFFSLQGFKAQTSCVFRLFSSQLNHHRYLVRQVIASFLGHACVGSYRVGTAAEINHPAAQSDPFSFCLIYENQNVPYPENRVVFAFIHKTGLLWKRGSYNSAFHPLRLVDFVTPYRRRIQ